MRVESLLKISGHFLNTRLVVMTVDPVRSAADDLEEQVSPGLVDREIAQFVED